MPWMLFANPWVILGLISALAGVFGYGHHVGWNSRDDQARIETAAANDAARILEQQLRTQLDDQTAQLRKANSEIARKTTALSAANAAGQLRLPTVQASCPSVQASSNAPAPAGDSREGPSELERQTIEALIAIAADGDRAAAKANACIDAYNKVRDQLNGQR